MRTFFVILSMLLLCSCEHFSQDRMKAEIQAKKDVRTVKSNITKKAMYIAGNVRNNIKNANDRMRNWWITPLPSNAKKPMPTRYCYRVLQDILCYRQQMLGWESKLVGYQGYKAAPPVPATIKLLPLRDDNNSSLPKNRAKSVKPVFASIPEVSKEKKEQSNKPQPVTIDSTNGVLPSSALTPQL